MSRPPVAVETRACAVPGCSGVLAKGATESRNRWLDRLYCSRACANRAKGTERTRAFLERVKMGVPAPPRPTPEPVARPWSYSRPPCPENPKGGHYLVQEPGTGTYAPFRCVACGYVFTPPHPREEDRHWKTTMKRGRVIEEVAS